MTIRTPLLSAGLLFSLAVILVACGPKSTPVHEPTPALASEPVSATANSEEIVSDQESYPDLWVEQVPRLDEQGAVIVEITPLNLNNPGNTLDFQVTLNTHSVELSMDLAQLSTLETDTGQIVQANHWSAPIGGHHVQGILSFPPGTNGPLLDGVSKITLTLINLDVPQRVFVWER